MRKEPPRGIVPLFISNPSSKIDLGPIPGRGHTPLMASDSKTLTREEFASLLTVGSATVRDPPAVIPTEHSARLIALGYMADIAGRLRMTTPGRSRIAAGFQKTGHC
jgi:hypothetical protein